MTKKEKLVIPTESNENTRRQRVQSAEMGLIILKTLAVIGGSASITALSKQLGENPAKIHRYLASLIETGFVYQNTQTGQYTLGLESALVGLAAIRRANVLTLASPVMTELSETLGLTCFIAVWGNMGPTIVSWEEPAYPVTVNVRVGSVLPLLWSATGRIFAAFSKAELIETFISRSLKIANSAQLKEIPDKKAAEKLFHEVRTAGYAQVRNTLLLGISAIATPIFNDAGRIRAAITVLGVTDNFDLNPSGTTILSLKQKTLEISTQLGYLPT